MGTPYSINYLGKAHDREIDREMAERARPWTSEEYERVRQAAITLVHSHYSYDAPDGRILSVIDGPLLWALMDALDRRIVHGGSRIGKRTSGGI